MFFRAYIMEKILELIKVHYQLHNQDNEVNDLKFPDQSEISQSQL